jgi:hypothetical protein
MVDREHGQARVVRRLGRDGLFLFCFLSLFLFLRAPSVPHGFWINLFLRLSYRPRLIYGWPSPLHSFTVSLVSLPFYLNSLFIFPGTALPIFVFLALPVPLAVRTINLTHYIRIVISPVVGVGLPRR